MLSRSVQLRRIAAARPLSLTQWKRFGLPRTFGGTALLARGSDTSPDTLYPPDKMTDMIREPLSKPLNHLSHESTIVAQDQEQAHAPITDAKQDESPETIEPGSSESSAAEHAEMPDIENYEPTDAELEEMLASAHSAIGDEGLSTEEAEAADKDTQQNEAHGEYDDLASEDDILFETSSTKSLPTRKPFNHELLTHQHLGVSALGRPVEALILKDPNRMRRSRKQIPVLKPDATEEVAEVDLKWTDYIAKPDDEQNLVLEAWDNIDEMRPTETKTITAREYHRIVAALVDGFTQGQLSSYLTMKHSQELEAQATEEPQMYPWIQKQTPWKAAYQIELESKKPKYICAAAIVDKIWKLEVREQVESLGRALIWVHPIAFRLLTGHGRPVLEAIQREMLNPGNHERLAAKSEESRIGIYASKAAIAPILERLNGVAQAATSAKLSTEHVKKENLTQPILNNLASITTTIIEKSSGGNELIVHWIADSDRPKPTSLGPGTSVLLERPADVVWRLLMAAQSAHEADANLSSKMMTRTGRGKKPKGAVYIDYHREDRSKSWRDKLRSWTRYTDAVGKPDEKRKLQPLKLATRVELPELPPSPITDAASVSEVTFATLGHVLHLKEAVKASTKKNFNKTRRILSPIIPHPAALTTLSAGDDPVTQSTAIILNFSPDPTVPHDGALPRVRLTLPVDETTDLSNFNFPPSSTLHAVTAQRVQDLLLPTESVDARLTQQRLVALDADQPALQQFLAASEFNLLQGRLRTPSRISLSLPAAAAEAPYLFMGLEVHQAVETRLAGHTIRYESIEAGQHGGQRQELSLHRAPATEKIQRNDGFLQLVEDVVSGNVFSWNDGPALMQKRSSETFTMDLLQDDQLEEETLVEGEQEPLLEGKEEHLLKEEEGEEALQPQQHDTALKDEDVIVKVQEQGGNVQDGLGKVKDQETHPLESQPSTEEQATTDPPKDALAGETAAEEEEEEEPASGEEASSPAPPVDVSSESKL
ncbi:hypothetical protein MY11210_002070 [Beauveria gryllotalpidicola]